MYLSALKLNISELGPVKQTINAQNLVVLNPIIITAVMTLLIIINNTIVRHRTLDPTECKRAIRLFNGPDYPYLNAFN